MKPARAEPDRRLLRCAAGLGVTLDARGRWNARRPSAGVRASALRVACLAAPGTITLITGPSGSGKSTLLRAVASLLGRRPGARVRRVRPVSRDRAVACLTRGPLESWLSWLGRLGLAEAGVMLGRAGQLSDGQADRVALAVAIESSARSGGAIVLIADEFTSRLDRLSARGVCAALHRAVRRTAGMRIIAATARDDAPALLRPHVHVRLSITGSPRFILARRSGRGSGESPCD